MSCEPVASAGATRSGNTATKTAAGVGAGAPRRSGDLSSSSSSNSSSNSNSNSNSNGVESGGAVDRDDRETLDKNNEEACRDTALSKKRRKIGRPVGSGRPGKGTISIHSSNAKATTTTITTDNATTSGGATTPERSDGDEPVVWPDAVSDELRQRVENFQPPHGYRIVPRKPRASSLVWYAGVRVAHVETKVEGWICLASEACASAHEVREFTGAISNWTKHLEKLHGLKSDRMARLASAKQEVLEAPGRLEEASPDSFFGMGRDRYRNVMLARVMAKTLEPFAFVEDGDVRHFHATMMRSDDKPTPPLSADSIKHVMLEMYAATKEMETGRLRALSDEACLPFVSLNVERWDCEASRGSFLGVRVFWVEEWGLRSAILAVKLYKPSSALGPLRASGLLLRWLKGVLADHGLTVDDIYSSTSDSGGEIERLLRVFLAAEWTCSVPHVISCALNEGIGSDADPAKSKNKEARAEIRKVKSLVEHLNKSPDIGAKLQELCSELYGEVFKLVDDAPHRWLGLVRVMERVLALFSALRTHYHHHEAKPFPLKDSETVLPELFALVQPISDIIKESQGILTSSAGKIVIRMAKLKTGVLNCDVSLAVTPLPSVLGGKEIVPKERQTEHADLHPVARTSREKLSEALLTRYYKPYWEDNAHIISDMAVALHPPLKKLKHINDMRLNEAEGVLAGQGGATTDSHVKIRRQRVYDKIKAQAVAAAMKAFTGFGEGKGGRKSGDLHPNVCTAKRRKCETARDFRVLAQVEEFGHLEDSSSDEAETESDGTPQGQVDSEWVEYMAMKNKLEEIPFDDVLPWWANVGSKKFRWLSHVARSVYGHAVTGAVIEREFGLASKILSPRRSRLDAAYVEILMYLNLNLDHIPGHIPKLPVKEAFRNLPSGVAGIDDLDESVVPSLTEMRGQPDAVEVDRSGLGGRYKP